MPKRIAAIPTDFLLREVASLDDSVLLLPEQVMIFTGLTRGILKERMRTRPTATASPDAPRKGAHRDLVFARRDPAVPARARRERRDRSHDRDEASVLFGMG
jgi:hypothetical protein